MENQAWILRSFLVQLERLDALGEEALNDIAEEFAVSILSILPSILLDFFFWFAIVGCFVAEAYR